MRLVDGLDDRLRGILDAIRASSLELWAVPKHEYYTDHTVAHSDRITTRLDGLSTGIMAGASPLSPHEVYILLAAAYLHDIGMQNEYFLNGDLVRIRDQHEKITYEMIVGSIDGTGRFRQLGLHPDPDLVSAVAKVAAGHRHGDLSASQFEQFPYGDEMIRLRLLAALLRLGDALDIDHRRVLMENLLVKRVPHESQYHWHRCYYVSGVAIEDEFIQIGYRLPQGLGYEDLIIPLVEDEIRRELSKSEVILRRSGAKIGLGDSGIRYVPYLRPMPDAVLNHAREELRKYWSRKTRASAVALPVDDLAKEVRFWMKAMGFEVTRQERIVGAVELTAERDEGLLSHRMLVRCVDGEIDVFGVRTLQERMASLGVQSGWIVSDRRVSPAARRQGAECKGMRVLTLADLVRELFGSYFRHLSESVEQGDVGRYYVDLRCDRPLFDTNGKEQTRDTHSIDGYIDNWLSERGSNQISVLGEYGSGKTWFCRHYASRQLRRYLENPASERIPLLITLRDYARSGDVRQLITHLLVDRYKVQMSGGYEVFDYLNRSGRLLMIFDGFDEMALQVDAKTTALNFEAIAQTAVPGSKVLLTCRTEYFRTWLEERSVLSAARQADDGPFPPSFDILYLREFDSDQIREVLQKRVPDRWQDYEQRIHEFLALPNLAKRPVLLDMIVATLPDLDKAEHLNHSVLYRTFTDRWIQQAITEERTLLDAESKRFFAQEMAWEMFRAGSLKVHSGRIRELVERYLRPKLRRPEDIVYLEHDIRTASFITKRDEAGNYEFMHRSFMEYFVAQKLASAIGSCDRKPLGEQALYYEIIRFLNQMIDAARDVPTLVAWRDAPDSTEPLRANCIRLSGQWVDGNVLSDLLALVSDREEPSSLRRDAVRSVVRILYGEEADWLDIHVRRTLQAYAIRTDRAGLNVVRLPITVKILLDDLGADSRALLRRSRASEVSRLLVDCLGPDEPEEVRVNASYALIHLATSDLEIRLAQVAAQDSSEHVRFNCCAALIAVDSMEARTHLTRLASHSSDAELVELATANMGKIIS